MVVKRQLALALAAVAGLASPLAADEIPTELIIETRIIEARSVTPDFKAMEELSFFINTDGRGVTEDQWLATVARQAPDSFLATLALETLPVQSATAELRLDKRSRSVQLSLDLSEFVPEEVFGATVTGELARSGETERAFERDIELRVGQTFVWSSRDLELSGSEYLSHFRDYEDRDQRGKLYDRFRDFTTFLVVAYSVRLAGDPESASNRVTLELPDGVDIPEFDSGLGIEIEGRVDLELDIDATGAPQDVKISRSSIPEVNSRILGEAATWRFPNARSQKGHLSLELKATP